MLAPYASRMRIGISDLGYLLNVPLQPNTYDGTSGLGGDTELKGLPKPITLGYVYNIAPVALGTVNLGDGALYTYQANWRDVQDFVNVRESGVQLADSGAVAPTTGQFRQWKANGVFQLGFTPAGPITCDVKGDSSGSYANNTGEVVTRMLTGLGAMLSSSVLETETFSDVDAMMSGEIGLYIGPREISQAAAVEMVLRHAALWLGGGRNGKLRLAFADPVVAPELRLSVPDIVALEPTALPSQLQPAPVHIDIVCERNWAPLTLSDIAGSVTAAQRRKLTNPGRRVRATSTALDARQLPDRVLTLPGLFRNNSNAQVRADQLRNWIEGGLRAFRVTTERYRNVVELGDVVWIETYPRHGLDDGFIGIVAGWQETPHTGRVTMTLIGN